MKDRPRLEPLLNGDFQVTEDCVFFVNGVKYTIPKGMRTDLGSVPWLFRWLIGTQGIKTIPYLVHDFFYRVQPPGVSRKKADKILHNHLLQVGTNEVKSYAIYKGVRIGGKSSWKQNSKTSWWYND